MAAAALPPAGPSPDGEGIAGVRMPPKYVLLRRHVEDALKGVPFDARDVTVWIHSSTLGIEKGCFKGMRRVSRILVRCGPQPHDVKAAVLGMFITTLRAYEPALVDTICGFVRHMGEVHHVGRGDSINTFAHCSALKEVVLPRSITHLGDNAFFRCTSLTSVTLPDSLTHLGDDAFNQCTSLTSVTFPDSLTHIGDAAFFQCTSLTSVTLPNSLTHIGNKAFYGCSALTAVTMPAVRPFIGDFAFEGCPSSE
jgi:hypothetical protein